MGLSKTGTARWCKDVEDACCFVNKNVALYWLKEHCSKDMEYIIFEAKANVELSNAVIQANGGQGTMELYEK